MLSNLTTTKSTIGIDYYTQWSISNQPIWINYPNTVPSTAQNPAYVDCYTTQLSLDQDTIEFLEMVLLAMGVDMSYSQFLILSPSERKSLIRNIKISNITK